MTENELSSYLTESQLSSPRTPASPTEVDKAIQSVLAEQPATKKWHAAIRRLRAMLFGVRKKSPTTKH
ncbi:hypothetical protein AC578_5133 [Pseudocercospora eumusae]|uniref:Uncharacterized protein n=1 Tax=Pseudocercospora eumusae TaxID=321146 RepID=A0A139HME2_9PEZI|nr:hypothetical protein AC578_5133 [Pseudocercospora eumusae]